MHHKRKIRTSMKNDEIRQRIGRKKKKKDLKKCIKMAS